MTRIEYMDDFYGARVVIVEPQIRDRIMSILLDEGVEILSEAN